MRDQALISPDRLAEELGQVAVLDVTVDLPAARFDGDYRVQPGRDGWLAGHIPGSAHLDLLTDLADHDRPYHFGHPARSTVLAALARFGAGGHRRIVVYDDGRMQWAARAWWMLRCAGVDARILDGGLAAWRSGDRPVERGDALVQAGAEPVAGPERDGWADLDEVAAISAGERAGTLICALSPQQFAGSAPSRYARRGHIPGSRNVPAAGLLAEGRSMLATERLGRLFAAQLADVATPLVVYCGGGVSACITALGLTLTGHRAVKVYDGSLEEWAADPALPMATSR